MDGQMTIYDLMALTDNEGRKRHMVDEIDPNLKAFLLLGGNVRGTHERIWDIVEQGGNIERGLREEFGTGGRCYKDLDHRWNATTVKINGREYGWSKIAKEYRRLFCLMSKADFMRQQDILSATCKTCEHFKKAYGEDSYYCFAFSPTRNSNNPDQEACGAWLPKEEA